MIRRAIALVPGRAPHHNSLGLASRLLGCDEEAARAFEAAAEMRPDFGGNPEQPGDHLARPGRREEAVVLYRRAAACAPGTAEVWYNLAGTLAETAAHHEADACYRRAIDLRPGFVDALSNYGRFLIGEGRWTEADAWLEEAVRLAPELAGLASPRRGPSGTGRTRGGGGDDSRALALDPGFADAHYNLGCLLHGDGRTDEALVCHAAAVASDPAHGAARLARTMACLPIVYRSDAEVMARREQYLTALQDLETAVEAPSVGRAVAEAIGASQPFFLP